MRRPLAALVLVTLLAAAPARAARLEAHFDCLLPRGSVSCEQLADAYFASLSFLERTLTRDAADFVLGVRMVGEDERTTLYHFHVEGPRASPSYARVERIPKELPDTAALLRALAVLQLLTAPQLALEQPGATNADGRLVLELGASPPLSGRDQRDRAELLPPGASTGGKTSGWYQSTSLLGSASVGDNTSLTANLSSDANYSSPVWRFRTGLVADYQKVIITLGDLERSEELLSAGAKALVARSLPGGSSVAVLSRVANSTAENLNFEGRAGLGLGWDLVPFMTQQGNSLGIQYVLAVTHHNYVRPNLLDQVGRTHLEHSLNLGAGLHLERMDVLTDLEVAAIPGDNRFHRVTGRLTWVYRLTHALSFTAFSNVSYRRAVLNQPKETLVESELEQFLRGGRFSTFGLQGGLTLNYTLGSAVLYIRDQRWRRF